MPRKAVYGKRSTTATYCATPSLFWSSSPHQLEHSEERPAKPSLPVTGRSEKRPIVEILADDLQNLGFESSNTVEGILKDKTNKRDNALLERDGNEKIVLREDCLKAVQRKSIKEPHLQRSRRRSKSASPPVTSQQFSAPTRAPSVGVRGVYGSTKLSRRKEEDATLPGAHCGRAIKEYLKPLLNLTNDATESLSFHDWADSLSKYFEISKIAEATYGEVYRLTVKSNQLGFNKSDESVLKIVPLKPLLAKNSDTRTNKKTASMSGIEDVANEIKLLRRMTDIPGFTNYRDSRVLQGRPPSQFSAAWKAWNKMRSRSKKSIFPDPARKTSYSESQLWAVIEMQDAGTDLENSPCSDVWMAWDVFWGVALALAKGEEFAKFEHRDLHLGNICVSQPKTTSRGSREKRPDRKLGFTGLETTIIDYSLSRAELGLDSCLGLGGLQEVAYLDLEKDPAIFQGDASEDYQYDIYRYMRAAVYFDNPLADNWCETCPERSWQEHRPISNVLWLHFLLCKITEQVKLSPISDTAQHENEDWEKVELELEGKLAELKEELSLSKMGDGGIRSAGDLATLALSRQWLDLGDVVGADGSVLDTSNVLNAS